MNLACVLLSNQPAQLAFFHSARRCSTGCWGEETSMVLTVTCFCMLQTNLSAKKCPQRQYWYSNYGAISHTLIGSEPFSSGGHFMSSTMILIKIPWLSQDVTGHNVETPIAILLNDLVAKLLLNSHVHIHRPRLFSTLVWETSAVVGANAERHTAPFPEQKRPSAQF